MKHQSKGFSLMELMITIVIIGVLAAIAFPSYQDSVRKSRRVEAKTALLDVMARQEQYFSEKRTYAGNFGDLGLGASGSMGTGMKTQNGYYKMSLTTATNSVSVTAVAQDEQTKDLVGTYSLSSNGAKTWKNSVTNEEEAGWE